MKWIIHHAQTAGHLVQRLSFAKQAKDGVNNLKGGVGVRWGGGGICLSSAL